MLLPARPSGGDTATLRAAWETGAGPGAETARATIALALLALGRADSAEAADAGADAVWAARKPS